MSSVLPTQPCVKGKNPSASRELENELLMKLKISFLLLIYHLESQRVSRILLFEDIIDPALKRQQSQKSFNENPLEALWAWINLRYFASGFEGKYFESEEDAGEVSRKRKIKNLSTTSAGGAEWEGRRVRSCKWRFFATRVGGMTSAAKYEAIVKLMEMLSFIQNMEWMNATSKRKANERSENARLLASTEGVEGGKISDFHSVWSSLADSLGRSSWAYNGSLKA